MTTESNVVILPDSVASGAHNVRTVTVYPQGGVSTTHGEEQQVVSLAGTDGTIIEALNGALPVSSTELAMLLRAVIFRLDLLNAAVDRNYAPPDELYK